MASFVLMRANTILEDDEKGAFRVLVEDAAPLAGQGR